MVTKQNSLTLKIDDLLVCESLTPKQGEFFTQWWQYDVQVLYGSAGTGKTFISVYKALEDVLDKSSIYKQLVILRSAVPARDVGALPGDLEEKSQVYELPYIDICHSLFSRRDAYDRLKEQKAIQFALTSYIRGITLDSSIIVVDEIQNMNYQELYSVMTRVGENSKIIFCGDFKQTDIRDSGLQKFLNVLHLMSDVCFYEFSTQDIVRSSIVKNFIIAEETYENEKSRN